MKQQFAVPDVVAPVVPTDAPGLEGWSEERRYRAGSVGPINETAAEYLSSRGLPFGLYESAGLSFAPDFYRNTEPKRSGWACVLFPATLPGGRIVALQGRRTFPHDKIPKDLVHKREDGPKHGGAFIVPSSLDGDVIVLTEAPIDALTLTLCGVPAVATFGTENRPEWLKRACSFKTVLLAQDADEGGDKAAAAWQSELALFAPKRVIRLRPEQGKDWNELLTSKGSSWLRSWLLPRVCPFPVVEANNLPAVGDVLEFGRAAWWMHDLCSDETYREAVERTAHAALDFRLPVQMLAIPAPEEGRAWYAINPNITMIVAMQRARYLKKMHGNGWDLTIEGRILSDIIVYMSYWWYSHPDRISRDFPIK
ncbi:MAG: toprim domain-containing protein [Armatimonadota bacterium]